jgi:pimeloyl-ACP methyl ester carboxylesterase
VCGWSFGANVALREAVDDDDVGAVVAIGLPLAESSALLPSLPDRNRLRGYNRPVLLLAGEADPFCPVPELKRLARNFANATLHIVPGTDHFFWKREREAAGIVGSFAQESLRWTHDPW